MNTNFSYDRMDYYAVLEYLKEQATYFSNGAWTDFSDGDIGTVLLKLIAMNTDTTNYQVEKGISELYLDTVKERVNAIALCKLIGYEPRHYQSAFVELTMPIVEGNFTNLGIPKYTPFTDDSGDITFYNIETIPLSIGINSFRVYQGSLRSLEISLSEIDDKGRYYLSEYNIATNTLNISQGGLNLVQVPNALYGEGEACYSIHIDFDNTLYIQFPTYYKSILSTNTVLEINYLLSLGSEGRIGAEIIKGTMNLADGSQLAYTNISASEGGYDPESIEEIRKNAPTYAKTMNTLVTLNDFRLLVGAFDGISDVVALDYNFPESGLQPPVEIEDTGESRVNDAYKVNLYILPTTSDSLFKEIAIDDTDETDTQYYLTDNDINVMDHSSPYEFAYSESTKTWLSTNVAADSSTASISFTPIESYDLIRVDWTVDSEEGYDTLYIDYTDVDNQEVHVQESGENQSGSVYILQPNNVIPINISYVKDGSSTTGSDRATFKIYGVLEDHGGTSSEEYLDEVKAYINDVNKKKPAGISVYFYPVEFIRPTLTIRVYMDANDLRYNSAEYTIKDFILKEYSRENGRKIGEALYQSHISKDILSTFDYVKYLEVLQLSGSVNGAIKPNNKQFVELTEENVTIKVVPYEETE